MTMRILLTSALLALPAAAQAEGVLNLYIWSDSISPELIAKFACMMGCLYDSGC